MTLSLLTMLVVAIDQTNASPSPDPPVSLRGSPASMEQQNRIAVEHGLDFYRTEEEIRAAVERGDLVTLPGNRDYEVADFVSLPYLRREARLFVERTAALYHEACDQRLVVTSGVRAIADQPPNAHALSVHPAGMAVDLRVSPEQSCRAWLEERLLFLEEQRVINGIREFRPPHYHVAVFPEPYLAFAQANPVATDVPTAEEVEDEPVGPGAGGGWIIFVVLFLLAVAAIGLNLLVRRGRRSTMSP